MSSFQPGDARKEKESDLAALVGSRICHDLISPLGAIGNGLELLAMAGGAEGPELALIEESLANATARIRFYRVGFGLSGQETQLGQAEIAAILRDFSRGGRFGVDWAVTGDVPRREAKLAFLILLCCESALAWGGAVHVSREGSAWRARAGHDKLRVDPALWARLSGTEGAAPEVSPAQAQFALAPVEAEAQGRSITVQHSDQDITISW